MDRKDYDVSINESRKLLSSVNLFMNPWAYRVSTNFIDAFRNNVPYNQAYKIWIRDLSYHFLFIDGSFIQFNVEYDEKGLYAARYWYYQNPYEFISYEDYLNLSWIDPKEADEVFISYYEQFLAEQTLNYRSIHFRYDFSRNQYIKSIHPASHLHFWENRTFRLPSSITLTPLLFTLLVVKQMYIEEWERNMTNILAILRKEKWKCIELKKVWLFDLNEELELYLW
jgi:hypothetical protein